MKRPTPAHWSFNLVILLNRLALGLYFLLAGVAKIRSGVENFVDGSFSRLQPSWLPEILARPYGYALPFLEVIVGGMLILGLIGRLAAGVIGMMLVSFVAAIYMAGAFDGSGPFHTNIILATLAGMLMFTGSGRFSMDAMGCGACRR